MIVLPYVHTQDNGKELRYMLRSLKNLNGFDGQVMIVGDRERWFRNIIHIPCPRLSRKPYLDQVMKMKLACDTAPDEFIAMQDDIYFTEPTDVTTYYIGELKDENTSYHKRSKKVTKELLAAVGLSTYDFEAHAPMPVERGKLLYTLERIIGKDAPLQWRSMYGNMWSIEAKYFEDKKTRTAKLKQGNIISTNFYTSELDKLFPEPSMYEG